MQTELLYILYTFNRKNILAKCWESLFSQGFLKPDRVLVIDDFSLLEVQEGLFRAHLSPDIPVDLFLSGNNVGYAESAKKAISLLNVYDPDFAFFVESDYLFRPRGLDVVMDLFQNNEFCRESLWCAGYSQPGYFKTPKETDSQLAKINGIENILNSDALYKPFEYITTFGEKVNVQFVGNTCGTVYYNWKKFKEICMEFPNEYKLWLRNTLEIGKEKPNLNDGAMSSISSYMWNLWAIKHGIDRNKYAAGFDIIPSVAEHKNGMGLNGSNAKEGEVAIGVGSPTWKE